MSSSPMSLASEPILIGRYQLQNLLSNDVRFNFFNLAETDSALAALELLKTAKKIPAESAFSEITSLNLSKDAPIVLICQQGMKSLDVAKLLGENSYLNVFVIEGGIDGISN